MLGIEMGANISNLSQTVDIQFSNVTKVKGKDDMTWIVLNWEE